MVFQYPLMLLVLIQHLYCSRFDLSRVDVAWRGLAVEEPLRRSEVHDRGPTDRTSVGIDMSVQAIIP